MTRTLDLILDGLMRRYKERVPAVDKIVNAMVAAGVIKNYSDIENDHVAFRTMGVPQLGIQSLEKIFLHCGYKKRDEYHFAEKKLKAFWYSPPEDKYPRIFISELKVGEFSKKFQDIINKYTGQVKSDPVDELDLNDGQKVDGFLHSALWSTPTWEEFQALLSESEYGSWVIYNRYYLNHFTISVHNLPAGYNTVADFNKFLEAIPVKLNDSGGKVKISPDGKLIQSSTVAAKVMAEFPHADGSKALHEISGSYVEFAERKPLDQFAGLPPSQLKREHRRDGFEASNADKIFESTFTSQTNK